VTSLLPIEEHSSTSRSVSPMSCQQPVTDVPSVGIHLGCHCSRGKEREMEDAHGSSGTEPQPVTDEPPPSTVDTAAKLIDALNRAEPGDTITLRSQEYRVGVPLFVRDGVTLRGTREMQFKQGPPNHVQAGNRNDDHRETQPRRQPPDPERRK
jgi:hypothetical protein